MIDCLEDPDDTLRLKTLELLATMTKANNVTVRRARAKHHAAATGGPAPLASWHAAAATRRRPHR